MKRVKFPYLFLMMLVASLMLSLASCDDEDGDDTPVQNGGEVSGNITADIKWSGTIKLNGFVYVKSPAVLTIEAGTIIKGVSGTKASLIVERGAKIMAEGSSQKPIVFTSDKAAGSRSYGDWGGLVICGKAKTNKSGGEGDAEGGIGVKYGGQDDADNSGILKYVRIEFAGVPLSTTSNSEINGLTLYSVGSGTTIENIQVSYSGDDAYEWFGGTVNCKNLVSFRTWDDDFDTDNGYRGVIQYGVALRDPQSADQSASNGFESDNDADGSTNAPVTAPIFANMSFFGPYVAAHTEAINTLYKSGMHIRRKSNLQVYNSVWAGWPIGMRVSDSKGAAGDGFTVKGCVLAFCAKNYNGTEEEPIFTKTGTSNSIVATNAELKYTSAFSLTAPNFLLQSGSPLLTGAVTVPTGVTATAYKGAFDGTNNWTAGWCNWNPQNTAY
jgi:hypothetical protein